ncbi:hypothetical protein BJ138DRAFT_1102704 [Hygrophoropsis aurantiaca]|uniref:Uncharacterized protein n=1 Tax=Hygrophoropsis aurantiaca TaxID=72124 RepID=A0ACB8A8R0_9AGAM|nr:hypothetical protein BJ138DRAFT_1102704 [Hygrophoropsis aurantiaca]
MTVFVPVLAVAVVPAWAYTVYQQSTWSAGLGSKQVAAVPPFPKRLSREIDLGASSLAHSISITKPHLHTEASDSESTDVRISEEDHDGLNLGYNMICPTPQLDDDAASACAREPRIIISALVYSIPLITPASSNYDDVSVPGAGRERNGTFESMFCFLSMGLMVIVTRTANLTQSYGHGHCLPLRIPLPTPPTPSKLKLKPIGRAASVL